MTISKNAEGREVYIYTEDEAHLNPRWGYRLQLNPFASNLYRIGSL